MEDLRGEGENSAVTSSQSGESALKAFPDSEETANEVAEDGKKSDATNPYAMKDSPMEGLFTAKKDFPETVGSAVGPSPHLTTSHLSPDGAATASTSSNTVQQTTDGASVVTLISVSAVSGKTREFFAKYFKPVEHDAPLRGVMDLPESYFSPTPSELQTAYAGQVAKRERLIDAPLLTSALRERAEAEKSRAKAARWPQTRIRVRFSDRSQLEGVFPSTDKLISVYEFVKIAMQEQHPHERLRSLRGKSTIDPDQTPPRREFKKGDPNLKGKTLMDLELTPSSVFYIKWEDDNLNREPDLHLQGKEPNSTPPLILTLLGAATDFPLPQPFDPTKAQADETKVEPKSKSSSSQKLGFGGNSGKVVPGWLKVGKSGSESLLSLRKYW